MIYFLGLMQAVRSVWHGLFHSIRLLNARAIGSVGEHFVHTEGVTGSNPVSPTNVQCSCLQIELRNSASL